MAVFGPDRAPLELRATGIACTAGLKHHAAYREGCGSGSSVGQWSPSSVWSFEPRSPAAFFLAHHAAPGCGKGWRSSGRTAPCTFGVSGKGHCLHLRPDASRDFHSKKGGHRSHGSPFSFSYSALVRLSTYRPCRRPWEQQAWQVRAWAVQRWRIRWSAGGWPRRRRAGERSGKPAWGR